MRSKGYYKNYEVTLGINGKRTTTKYFGKLDTAKSFIDKVVLSNLQEGDVDKFYIEDDYKILIHHTNENIWFAVTIVQVEREFMDMPLVFGIDNR